MIKKVKIDQLKIGMFVHDFNCGWMDHPFFQRRMIIKTESALKKVLDIGIHELYIDTEKGLDVIDAPEEQVVQKELKTDLLKTVKREKKRKKQVSPPKSVSYYEEIENAKNIKINATDLLQDINARVVMGKKVQIDELNPLMDNMIGSVKRNKDALISLFRVKDKDTYTYLHSLSVGAMMIAFGRSLGIRGEMLNQYGIAGLLHDIGKMRIPLNLLNKPTQLSEDEYEIMKSHVTEGREILSADPGMTDVILDIVSEHHEREDGTGYPYGMSAGEISRGGKIAAIIDVFDALSSDRIYTKALPPVIAIQKIFEWKKHYFQEDLVNKFINFMGIYPVGSLVKLDSKRTAIVIESNHLTPVVRIVYENLNKKKLMSRPIDLSSGTGLNDRVVGFENPAKLGMNMKQIMELAQTLL